MGCDIHMYVERFTNKEYIEPIPLSIVREKKIENILDDLVGEKTEKWVSVDKWIKNKHFNVEYGEPEWEVPYKSRFYNDRNYYLFAILTNVGNYDNQIDCISKPKGIP